MTTSRRPLGSFEDRLLAELKHEIVTRNQSRTTIGHRRRFAVPVSTTRRLAIAGGLASVLAIAVAAGLPLPGDGDGTEAYAVTKNDDGSVSVEVASLEDAAGLERELREAGVRAVVQYVPPGKACTEQTFVPARAETGRMSVEMRGGGPVRFTIENNGIAPGTTLVIQTQRFAAQPGGSAAPSPTGAEASGIALALAQGSVAPCELVDAGLSPPTLEGGGAGAEPVVESFGSGDRAGAHQRSG
jgi:hypothetical protein